jgi:hypothetical protein
MIQGMRKHLLYRVLHWLLLLNFINLTANFYQPSVLDDTILKNSDPIDNLTELVMEFMLGCDDSLIPDTELPVDKRKFLDFQLIQLSTWTTGGNIESVANISGPTVFNNLFDQVDSEITPPPPKQA